MYLANEFDSKKQTLFLLHGFPDNFRVWEPMCNFLNNHFNIICPSSPGTVTDDSDLLSKYRLENLSKYYREILSFAMSELTNVTIVAHDMAGPYAHHMLGFLPDDTKLICINTLSGQMMLDRKSNPKQMIRSAYMSLFQLPFFNKKLLSNYWMDLRKSAARLGRSSILNIPASYNENILNGFFFYKALIRDVKIFLDHSKWKNDVLYLWSDDDPFLVKPTTNEMERRYDHYSIIDVESGHWPMLDVPEDLANKIMQFHGQKENDE
ncbi:MAG: alpha/beta hydrolase [Bacteriovoracaceae bacterium]|nr:alpha/beta hydrolase [Bacteriovoracaceae bacterium]